MLRSPTSVWSAIALKGTLRPGQHSRRSFVGLRWSRDALKYPTLHFCFQDALVHQLMPFFSTASVDEGGVRPWMVSPGGGPGASESNSADDQGGPEHHDSLRMATQEPTDTTDEAPSTVSFGLLSDGTDTPQHFQRIQGSLVPRF